MNFERYQIIALWLMILANGYVIKSGDCVVFITVLYGDWEWKC